MANESGFAAEGGDQMVKATELVKKVETLDPEKVNTVKNAELEEVKKELEEKKLIIGEFKKENEAMKDRFLVEINESQKVKVDLKAKVGELENVLKDLEEGTKTILALKENEINLLKKEAEKLDAAISYGRLELFNDKVEKKALEDALEFSVEKIGELEAKVIQLEWTMKEAEDITTKLMVITWGAGVVTVVMGGIAFACLRYAKNR